MKSLACDGALEFIKHASEITFLNEVDFYEPIKARSEDINEMRIMSFHDFIYCVVKYTRIWKSPVRVDAKIAYLMPAHHTVVFTGIRDPGRDKRFPHCFKEKRNAVWHCDLEDVLQHGMDPELVDTFRSSFNLIAKYHISNYSFFKRKFSDPL